MTNTRRPYEQPPVVLDPRQLLDALQEGRLLVVHPSRTYVQGAATLEAWALDALQRAVIDKA